jgi:hypothetical protein
MELKTDNTITIVMNEEQAIKIRDLLYWLDFSTIPDEFRDSFGTLYNLLKGVGRDQRVIPSHNMVLKRKYGE